MVAWISGGLNHPRARLAVKKFLGKELIVNPVRKTGETRGLHHGSQGEPRNCETVFHGTSAHREPVQRLAMENRNTRLHAGEQGRARFSRQVP